MITLDMTKKSTKVAVTEKAFSLETGILVLQISLGTYDLTDKTITAVFDVTGIETTPLNVVADVIQLPITQGLVLSGYNNIQLNIREGLTLEQSPIMVWQVMPSLNGTDPAPSDVDIITALLAQAAATVARAEAAETVTGGDKLATAADRIATGEDRAAVNGALDNFDDVTLPAAVKTVDDETAAQILLVEGTGDAELSAIADAGDVQVGRVADEGTDQIILVQAEGDAQILRVQGAGDAELLDIGDAGDAQVLRVAGEGDTQVGRVTSEGGTQVGLVQAAGAVQVAAVQAELPYIRENIAKDQQDIKLLESALVQLNPSGDAKVTVTGYDTITSLPKNVAQAGLSVIQGGMTVRNLVDGDFSATADWTSTFATFTVLAGVGSVLADAQYDSLQQAITATAASKYYLQAQIKLTTGTVDVALRFNDGTTSTDTATVSSVAWQKVSAIITAGANGAGFVGLVDKRASGWDTIQVKDFRAVNLTAIAQQALTLSQADAMLLDYFSGTQSAVTGRVRSVGKNLFDGIVENGTWDNGGTEVVNDLYHRSVNYTKVKPNTTYVKSYNGVRVTNHYTKAFDKDKNYIAMIASGFNTLTTPADCHYIKVSYAVATGLNQVELGTVATTYSPYVKTESYTKPLPLYRVPNGVADTIEGGKYYQRVKKYVLLAADIAALITTPVYMDVLLLTKKDGFIGFGNATLGYNSAIMIPNFVASGYADSITNIGTAYIANNATMGLTIAKGTYANLAAARAALAGTVIYYQLAVPNITDNVTSGTLLAYPSGTIYWEPVIADIGIYGASLAILNTAYPIQSIERIYKIDPISGSQLELNPASAVIASGGLTFTHPSAVSGDLIFFTYYFNYTYPHGLGSYTYLDSRAVVLGDDGKYYKIGFSVTGGVVGLTKTEVV